MALSVYLNGFGQSEWGRVDPSSLPRLKMHALDEYSLDSPVNPAEWNTERPGLHAGFGSTDKAYFRTELPKINADPNILELIGWRGERINAMILTWSADSVNQVHFILHDLKDTRGNIISNSNLQLNMIRYVVSNYPYDAAAVSCGEGPVDKAYLMPDRFESFDRFDIPAKSVRPVWLSANIPAGLQPGTYKGTIEVKSQMGSVTLNLTIRVQNQTLPKPHDWTFQLDLWQNPTVIAEYYQVKPWGEEHKTLLKKHLKLYADAGGKFITTYAVHSPWSDGSYRLEAGMIEWIKRNNGSWKFDYTVFDEYVKLAMETGIDKAITIYTPLPFGERFRYLEEKSGNYIIERWAPESDTFRTNWNIFLTDLKAHLQKKGWLEKTYLGINENAMEQTLAAIRMIKAHSRQWKITYAGDWHPELDDLLNDYSCKYGMEPSTSDVTKRKSKGQTSTYYICCDPAKPNTFVFSPPVEGRWLGWHAYAYGYNGMLRWAYDAWPADPAKDTRHVLWPSGDCFMVYPGGVSNVRFEKMREGIADYEKLKILISKAANSSDPVIKDLAKQLNQHLRVFDNVHEFREEKLSMDIQKGKKLMDELSEKLN